MSLRLSVLFLVAILFAAPSSYSEPEAVLWEDLPSRMGDDLIPLDELKADSCPDKLNSNDEADRLVFQWIEGTSYKWKEYVLANGKFCIVMEKPTSKKLTLEEARVLLSASRLWMTENQSGNFKGGVADPDDPHFNVPPMPLPRPDKNDVEGKANRSSSNSIDGEDSGKEMVIWDLENSSTGNQSSVQTNQITTPDALCDGCTDGVDNRVNINETTIFPYQTVIFFSGVYASGAAYRCSAMLITPTVAITAAHCLYGHGGYGGIASGTIYPGVSQCTSGGDTLIPFGGVSIVMAAILQGYQDVGTHNVEAVTFDIGGVKAASSIAGLTTFMPVQVDYSYNAGDKLNNLGHPALAHGVSTYGMFWGALDIIETPPDCPSDNDFFYSNGDISGGNSGGPVYSYSSSSGVRRLVAVISSGVVCEGQWKSLNARFTSYAEFIEILMSWEALSN